MVRKLNHRFKHFLAMDAVFGSVIMVGAYTAKGDKMWFSVRFNLKSIFKTHLSRGLCRKPSFPDDVVQPFGH
jgi:hypothetical protein